MSKTHFNHRDTQKLKKWFFFRFFPIFSRGSSHNPYKDMELGRKKVRISTFLSVERPLGGLSGVLGVLAYKNDSERAPKGDSQLSGVLLVLGSRAGLGN